MVKCVSSPDPEPPSIIARIAGPKGSHKRIEVALGS
jgi:hypothetical protein